MAEVQTQQSGKKRTGVKRSKKLPTRVDLTPMVDLGFLLITFFVFTTSLAQPKVMKLAMPDENPAHKISEWTEGKVLTLVLKDDETVGYYNGTDVQHMQFTNYGTGLRDVILQKQQAVAKKYGSAEELSVLIKPTDNAVYRDVVATLNEMLITGVKIYMLLDANKQEAALAAK